MATPHKKLVGLYGKTVADLAVQYTTNANVSWHKDHASLYSCLSSGFAWKDTPQGSQFWLKIAEKADSQGL